jgi:hypothetical protein
VAVMSMATTTRRRDLFPFEGLYVDRPFLLQIEGADPVYESANSPTGAPGIGAGIRNRPAIFSHLVARVAASG